MVDLILALQNLPAAQLLLSNTSYGTFYNDFLQLSSLVDFNDFNIKQFTPFLKTVINYELDKDV